MDTRTRDKNLRPESDTTRDKEETAIRRHIFRNRLISIVRPHSESRSVPMNRLAENMSWSGGTQLIRSSSSNSSRLWLTYHVIFIVSPSFSPPPTFPRPALAFIKSQVPAFRVLPQRSLGWVVTSCLTLQCLEPLPSPSTAVMISVVAPMHYNNGIIVVGLNHLFITCRVVIVHIL